MVVVHRQRRRRPGVCRNGAVEGCVGERLDCVWTIFFFPNVVASNCYDVMIANEEVWSIRQLGLCVNILVCATGRVFILRRYMCLTQKISLHLVMFARSS